MQTNVANYFKAWVWQFWLMLLVVETGKNNNLLPYNSSLTMTSLKALSRMGIETPGEFRSALREFYCLYKKR